MWTILISIINAILYRLGGWGDEGRKSYPKLPEWVFNTKARDIGCPLSSLILVIILGVTAPWYIHLLCFLLLFGALTTYWDFITGKDNFWLHGFACGVAYLPYALYTGDWWQTILRCFVLSILMGGISKLSGNDVVEECGRGSSISLTLPIL